MISCKSRRLSVPSPARLMSSMAWTAVPAGGAGGFGGRRHPGGHRSSRRSRNGGNGATMHGPGVVGAGAHPPLGLAWSHDSANRALPRGRAPRPARLPALGHHLLISRRLNGERTVRGERVGGALGGRG